MIAIILPIVSSLLLFGYLWFKLKEKNTYSIVMLILSGMVPVSATFSYQEMALIMFMVSIMGLIASLVPNKTIAKFVSARIMKLFVTMSFMVCSCMLLIAAAAPSLLYNNHYSTAILVTVNIVIIAIAVFITYKRIQKIRKSA